MRCGDLVQAEALHRHGMEQSSLQGRGDVLDGVLVRSLALFLALRPTIRLPRSFSLKLRAALPWQAVPAAAAQLAWKTTYLPFTLALPLRRSLGGATAGVAPVIEPVACAVPP